MFAIRRPVEIEHLPWVWSDMTKVELAMLLSMFKVIINGTVLWNLWNNTELCSAVRVLLWTIGLHHACPQLTPCMLSSGTCIHMHVAGAVITSMNSDFICDICMHSHHSCS